MGYVVVGQIGAPYGVKGWVHVRSFTEPASNLFSYPVWYLRPVIPAKAGIQWQAVKVLASRSHGKWLVAAFADCLDREAAEKLTHAEIGVPRESLPPLEAGEYYWVELIGLQVETETGIPLGIIKSLLETGSNDVLIVQGESKEHLIPYIPGEYVLNVDLAQQKMIVYWDPEF